MMTRYLDFVDQRIKNLKPYQPGKTAAEIKRTLGLEKIVKLASNENPYGPSPQVIAALQAMSSKIALYPEDQAPLLRQRLSQLLEMPSSQISLGAGSSELLEQLVRIFVHENNAMIISENAFVLYKILGKTVGANVICVKDQQWRADLEAMLKAITNETRMLIIANPNNPTGTWHSFIKLKQFIEKIPKHVIVVIDEAYFEYMQAPEYRSVATLINQHSNLVVMRTFSKIYGLAGMRIGYCVSNAEVADLLNRIRKPFNVSLLSLLAAEVALADQNFINNMITLNQEQRTKMHRSLAELGLNSINNCANFLTVEFGVNAQKVAEQLLQRGVIVRPLMPYNMPHHLRISIGTQAENDYFIAQLTALAAQLPLLG